MEEFKRATRIINNSKLKILGIINSVISKVEESFYSVLFTPVEREKELAWVFLFLEGYLSRT